MSDHKKDRVALIIAKMKGGNGHDKAEDDDKEKKYSGDDDGLESAAEDLISAVNDGDASKVVRALRDFLDVHGSREHGKEDDEDEED